MKLHRPFLFLKASRREHGYSKEQCIRSASIVVRSVFELRETLSHVWHVYHHAFAATIVLFADIFESIEKGAAQSIIEEKRRTLLLAQNIFVPDRIPGHNLNHLVRQAATAVKLLLDGVQVKSNEDTDNKTNRNSYNSFVQVLQSVAGRLETLLSDGAQAGFKPRVAMAVPPTPSSHTSPMTHLQPPQYIENTQATGGSVQAFEYALQSTPFQQPIELGGSQPAMTTPVPVSAAPLPLSHYPPQQQLTIAQPQIQPPYTVPSNSSQFSMQQFPSHHNLPHAIPLSRPQMETPYVQTPIGYHPPLQYKQEPSPHYMSKY
ncbi:hypothetical protein BT69DRAFT_221689 [Atractiella rhizophila]|nr:hypothetical protein BT69DRAFT_221689 [Atractiella rhizophila]